MASIQRLVFITLALGLAACAGEPKATECSTGITCPEGTKCAAVQQICLINDCGDGIVQSSEQCDDGNVIDGDGCAADCRSREICGDNVLNAAAGELCDDGNTTGGDGCAEDCKSVEICGNGIRDVNEACDDGNTLPGDGCSGNCKSTEICGNGIVDLNEKCDDGGAAGGCNDDCQGGTGCGDGAIDISGGGVALEECDDGNTDNFDDCTNLCALNVCGDGIVQASGARVEECDPSVNFVETAGCNLDCTMTECGDDKINKKAGEQCDDGVGNNADDRDCTSICHKNICGDTLVNSAGTRHEDCDDGDSDNFDGCSVICSMPTCGNGVIEQGEACDDDNTTSGDGCSGPGTPGCQFETCGDGITNNGEDCDDGVGGVAKESMDCNIDCTDWACGDGKVNKEHGEQCDDKDPANPDCLDDCTLNVCGDGIKSSTEQCDDGDSDNADGCTTSCTTPTCSPPNGIRDMGEQCDDGNTSNTDGCINTCLYATCGDGFKYTSVEECDNGTANNGIGKDCTATCKTNICGDNNRDLEGSSQEACDLGSFNGQTACPYGQLSCSTCLNTCSVAGSGTTTFCGDRVTQSGNGEACDDGSITQGCGQCDNACNTFTAAAQATALIVAAAKTGSVYHDGDTFTLSDGVNSVIFEFDTDNMFTAATGKVKVDANGTLDAGQVRDKVAAAISTAHGLMLPVLNEGLHITTTNLGDSGLLLKNERSSSIGNTTISRTGLGSAFFTSTGFTGGAAGDCAVGTPCRDNEDCLAADGTGFGTCGGNPKVCQ